MDHDVSLLVERAMAAPPRQIYDAWVRHLDTWFAAPGSISMHDGLVPFWFATEHEGARHSHYGRFLTLDEPSVIEMTWVTGRGGTNGAETVVRVELMPAATGTALTLRHSGFYDEVARDQHLEAWPRVLEHLDHRLQSGL
ncbi:MAG TPA: SRPBCC domain-containing protein [Acidimicrobiales bacterium]|jgi:uncharacterized protein YndB with AHSA1/START domain|nr:SRPBCC domain-containing protein [Acidimicrobiales bacterium]